MRRSAARSTSLTAALPRLVALALSIAALAAVAPATASAGTQSIYSQIRLVYERSNTIPPCEFSSPELTSALNSVDAYGLEYFADFIAAIHNALTLRAAGACSKRATHVSTVARSRTPPAALPSSLTAPTNAELPVPVLLLAVLGGVLAVVGAAAALVRIRSLEGTWSASWRHGAAEARYRAGDLRDTLTGRRFR